MLCPIAQPPTEHKLLLEKGRGGPEHEELSAVNTDFCKVITKKKEKFSLPSLLSKKKCLLPSSRHAGTVSAGRGQVLGRRFQSGLWLSLSGVYNYKAGQAGIRGF